MKALSKGQWWNEDEGRWVSSNLQEIANDIKDLPVDDSDILEKFEEKVEESIRLDVSGPKIVKDTHYYSGLEVDANAESSAIKRRYVSSYCRY
jgi:hypothetical protein